VTHDETNLALRLGDRPVVAAVAVGAVYRVREHVQALLPLLWLGKDREHVPPRIVFAADRHHLLLTLEGNNDAHYGLPTTDFSNETVRILS